MKKILLLSVSLFLAFSLAACSSNGNTGIQEYTTNNFATEAKEHNEIECTDETHNHSINENAMILYSENEYKEMKNEDKLKDTYTINYDNSKWKFNYISSINKKTQAHAYIYNDYNNILIERSETKLDENAVLAYLEYIKSSYQSPTENTKEYEATISSYEIEHQEGTDYFVLKMEVNDFIPSENGNKKKDNMEQLTLVQTETYIEMRIISNDTSTFFITYSSMGKNTVSEKAFQEVGAENILNSFKII